MLYQIYTAEEEIQQNENNHEHTSIFTYIDMKNKKTTYYSLRNVKTEKYINSLQNFKNKIINIIKKYNKNDVLNKVKTEIPDFIAIVYPLILEESANLEESKKQNSLYKSKLEKNQSQKTSKLDLKTKIGIGISIFILTVGIITTIVIMKLRKKKTIKNNKNTNL